MAETTPPQNAFNRLADSKSPYLLQHADNPVAWHPWGKQAFEKAKKEDQRHASSLETCISSQ